MRRSYPKYWNRSSQKREREAVPSRCTIKELHFPWCRELIKRWGKIPWPQMFMSCSKSVPFSPTQVPRPDDPEAWTSLEQQYLRPILDAAADNGGGLILDALLWRAQPDFVAKLGRPAEELGPINRRAIARTRESVYEWRRARGHDEHSVPVLVAADIGPRGDGYRVEQAELTAAASRDYHAAQLQAVAEAEGDLVCALTMTSAAESIGIVEAARPLGLPVIVSPTVETDGRLPDGTLLGDFIREVDAATDAAPLFYMVNCAHPRHLRPSLDDARANGEDWLNRFRGFRANSSEKSHEELDNSTELDRGDVQELSRAMADMCTVYGLSVIGGCCGTDHEHLREIASMAIGGSTRYG